MKKIDFSLPMKSFEPGTPGALLAQYLAGARIIDAPGLDTTTGYDEILTLVQLASKIQIAFADGPALVKSLSTLREQVVLTSLPGCNPVIIAIDKLTEEINRQHGHIVGGQGQQLHVQH
ncbi:MAG: hypothetical protein JWM46_612 [Candidatus Kaiserbacteria bacterium]|nr:hypothetical protein [Candidatus Kaiserbacteria bacterium]